MRLFSWFILRRLFHEPLRSITTALGIALGVGVIVAIQLTNASSLAGFQTALDTVSGRAALEVVGTGLGVDERRLPELGWLREYGDVAPIIEGDAVFRQPGHPSERLRVLGIDILRDRPFREYRLLESTAAAGELAAAGLPGAARRAGIGNPGRPVRRHARPDGGVDAVGERRRPGRPARPSAVCFATKGRRACSTVISS